MGGKSSSKSSNSTSSSTDNSVTDNRIGVADNGMVATDGSTINVESADANVVEAALAEGFGFGKEALETVGDTVDALEEIKAIELKATADNLNAAKENFDLLLKAGTAIAVAYFAMRAWK